MAEVEELLDGVAVRLPAAEEIRRRGQRRRARRRTGAAALCTVALLAAGAWALLPGGPDGPDGRGAVAIAPDNPFRENGAVRNLPAKEVPLYGTWRWKDNEGRPVDSDARGDLLNRAGLGTFCPGTSPETGRVDRIGYTKEYRGVRKAVARQCLVEYDDEATAGDELRTVLAGLDADGLSRTAGASQDVREGAAAPETVTAWSGKVPGGHTLRVFTQRWKSWVSVVEVLDGDS
ncbi:hypothetical protein ACFYXP_05040 [Streptomyces sp. NPDC002466]|uniref:hypothetical protein n=1 Tax=unclassified Streptomyces TaxID=2593676 RepID=UPI0011E6BED1|nr:hypothetical protein [Streptomyces sp. sk2.1]TXS69484.1 hypothetical protein EAO76_26015 [Streptomyces sp. sk2.1]